VDRVEVSTVVYLPPEEVYEFLVDFPGYADYSKYLERVKSDGDGSPGTRYALRFSWWKVTYTAHTRVTDADPPNRIDWEVIKDMNAHGHWLVGVETAIIVMFLVNENWTFAAHGEDDRASFLDRLKRSHVVRAAGVATQFVVFVTVYRLLFRDLVLGDIGLWASLTGGFGVPLAGLDLWLLLAKGLGVGVGMVVNYVFESLFTWQVHQ